MVLRPLVWQRLLGALIGLGAGLVAVGAGAAAGGWLAPAGMLGGALMLALVWRGVRQRVELRAEAVVVLNNVRTLVIPWPEVERFTYGLGAMVVRTDGRVHRMDVFTPQGMDLPFVHRQCENAVRVMEEFREERQRVGGEDVPVGRP